MQATRKQPIGEKWHQHLVQSNRTRLSTIKPVKCECEGKYSGRGKLSENFRRKLQPHNSWKDGVSRGRNNVKKCSFCMLGKRKSPFSQMVFNQWKSSPTDSPAAGHCAFMWCNFLKPQSSAVPEETVLAARRKSQKVTRKSFAEKWPQQPSRGDKSWSFCRLPDDTVLAGLSAVNMAVATTFSVALSIDNLSFDDEMWDFASLRRVSKQLEFVEFH